MDLNRRSFLNLALGAIGLGALAKIAPTTDRPRTGRRPPILTLDEVNAYLLSQELPAIVTEVTRGQDYYLHDDELFSIELCNYGNATPLMDIRNFAHNIGRRTPNECGRYDCIHLSAMAVINILLNTNPNDIGAHLNVRLGNELFHSGRSLEHLNTILFDFDLPSIVADRFQYSSVIPIAVGGTGKVNG